MSASVREPARHWPAFAGPLCGTVDDRERLGLPDHFVSFRLDEQAASHLAAIRGHSVDALIGILESPHAPLPLRIAAGDALALAGDPRVRVLEPAMITVPGGVVEIGLPFSDLAETMSRFDGLGLDRTWIEKECPRHTVTLEPFRIARFPVTNAEYRAFLLDTGHAGIPSSWTYRRFPFERANHPVYTVDPASADAYARWLATRTGRGFRLPGEAEWEWAAAGPDGREFPWGDTFDPDRANTAETGLFRTSAVGAYAGGESPFGLADTAGNVEEYCADEYAPYPGGHPVDDHLAQMHGSYRIARGGSFARFRDLARVRRRHGHNPRSATYAMGFRLAETL
ncbi:MAG: SUMF1/EgtB/PvdO family nonheme iron enzyme [Betaproteobacteria bacterium]|nr:SUMF1/EgtB/PvdO family nonheme iron enzyme [Betaproteobacteria bacterium]